MLIPMKRTIYSIATSHRRIIISTSQFGSVLCQPRGSQLITSKEWSVCKYKIMEALKSVRPGTAKSLMISI